MRFSYGGQQYRDFCKSPQPNYFFYDSISDTFSSHERIQIEEKHSMSKKSKRHNQPKALHRKLLRMIKIWIKDSPQKTLLIEYLTPTTFQKLKNVLIGFEDEEDKQKFKKESIIGQKFRELLLENDQQFYDSIGIKNIKERAKEFIKFLSKGIVKLKYKVTKSDRMAILEAQKIDVQQQKMDRKTSSYLTSIFQNSKQTVLKNK